MSSFGILRTNVGLTTNAKIVVNNKYNLYVDAIISNSELADTKFRKMEFNKSNYWDEILPYFFKNTPADIAFFVKDDNDADNMSRDFSKQFDDLYQYGARNITENKDYAEEFEYFAPLYVSKSNLPSNFIIFRVDGPGLTTINTTNFRSEILSKLKCVKVYDLTRKTVLGEWLDLNITTNKSFPDTPFYMDFRRMEFSSWYGIDYTDGGYSEKSNMLDSLLEYEQTFFDFERFVYNGYRTNKVAFPHILNFSFLFDDTPATPISLRKWSINRYLGFYLDSLEFVKFVSPYILPDVKSDVVIDTNNYLYSLTSESPFVESFKKEDFPYIEIGGNIYKIEKFFEPQSPALTRVRVDQNTFEEKIVSNLITRYKIISEINLSGRQNEINKNLINIQSTNSINKITDNNGLPLEIPGFDDADVWLIEINGIYHNIIKDGGDYFINTDYAFSQSLEKFDYYINDPNPNYRTSISLKVDAENEPKRFAIYKCKFTEIKDFDTDIVETQFSKHEYIKKTELTFTDEPKMYAANYDSNANPKDLDDFKINGQVTNIPVASEYTANHETFRLIDGKLSDLWKKNNKRVKWGFQNSSSTNDYPYLLNNSLTAGLFNKGPNTFLFTPNRGQKNLDYFLTINPDVGDYSHHSLHVVDTEVISFTSSSIFNATYLQLDGVSNMAKLNIGDRVRITSGTFSHETLITHIINNSIATNFNFLQWGGTSGQITNLSSTAFDLGKYLGIDYELDYFNYFFGQDIILDDQKIKTQKWSVFDRGDNTVPNITVFRGLKVNALGVNGVKITNNDIEKINTFSNNTFVDYKFAILASKNNFTVTPSPGNLNIPTIEKFHNQLRWQIIDDWKPNKIYEVGSKVRHHDIIYLSLTESKITDPTVFPHNSPDWTLYTQSSIFWSPIIDGTDKTTKNNMYSLIDYTNGEAIPPLVYNYGQYYFSTGLPGNNFWDPANTYPLGSVVLYKNKIWTSNIETNTEPGSEEYTYIDDVLTEFWTESPTASVIWKSVELWDPEADYQHADTPWDPIFNPGWYVFYDDKVWFTTVNKPQIGVPPTVNDEWKRVYSLVPDSNFVYHRRFEENRNPIILQNNRLYCCVDNGPTSSATSTLDNGINIYVNKKFKNILVNIYVNDNTFAHSIDPGLTQFTSWPISKDYLSNTNRDDLYSDIFSKLSADNFTNAVNDVKNFYGFSDKIKYIIINEDGSRNIYDFNNLFSLTNLPVLLTVSDPDPLRLRLASNTITPINLEASQIKPKRFLEAGNIATLEQLNYYNKTHLAVEINQVKSDPLKISNFSGLTNINYIDIYRHSGYYAPIFHTIQLFQSPSLTQSSNNYKFDTTLSHFGMTNERVFSKINRNNNILKLKNNPDLLSVYPMLDEFGYSTSKFFIFKSSWDYEYHIECVDIPQTKVTIQSNQSLAFTPPQEKINNLS